MGLKDKNQEVNTKVKKAKKEARVRMTKERRKDQDKGSTAAEGRKDRHVKRKGTEKDDKEGEWKMC